MNTRKFNVGDKVLLHDQTIRKNRSKKLRSQWLGPYNVISVDSPVNSTIKAGRRTIKVHNNRLKHFYE